MTWSQKRGALLFFGKAGCVKCHAVAGPSNEMFSDFKAHRIGGPQLAPVFGIRTGNTIFDGPGENEDFGLEQTLGDPAARYSFRTAPLRNLKLASAFFHNGSFGTLQAAIAHHLDVEDSLRNYDPIENNVPPDLSVGPFQPILDAGIDPLLREPIEQFSRVVVIRPKRLNMRAESFDKRRRQRKAFAAERASQKLSMAYAGELRSSRHFVPHSQSRPMTHDPISMPGQ